MDHKCQEEKGRLKGQPDKGIMEGKKGTTKKYA